MAVAAGSIAFVAFSFDNAAEGFAFVVLSPIAPGDSIRFVDGGKNGATLSADAQLVWTNTGATALQPGTVVQISLGAAPSNAATVIGGGAITTQPSGWQVGNNDSLFAVTGTVAAPGTYVAALLYEDTTVGTLTAGASVVTLDTGAGDVGSINAATAGAAHPNPGAARTAYTTAANWTQDGGVNNGGGAEWPPLSDVQSPLYNKSALVVAPVTTIALVSDTGGSATDGVTAIPALRGTASDPVPGLTVTIYDSGARIGTATTGAGGAWSFTPAGAAGAEGAHSYTATVTESSGATGAASGALAVKVDTTAPTTTLALALDTGASDNATFNPALKGTVSDGAAGATVTVFDGATAVGTATTGAGGAWTFANASAAAGGHSYTAKVTDAAGNSGPASPALAATITTSPIAFVGFSFDNHNAGMGNTQGFAFTALEAIGAGASLRFVDGGMAADGTLRVDSQVVWTNDTGAAIAAGTVVQVTFTGYSGPDTTDTSGFQAAAVNIGSVTAPARSDGAAAALWNVDLTDSLYAVTSTTGTAATTTVAAVVWGSTATGGITAGASVLDPTDAAAYGNDTQAINAATVNASYADAAAARAAYTNRANWISDDDSSDGAAGAVDADWPPLSDANSPLYGKATLTVAAPTFSFGDANGLVNNAEAAATPVSISGLGTGATAVVTFKSSGNGAAATHTFAANGSADVDLSALADGSVSVANVAVTSGGTTTNYANPPASGSITLDKTPPAAPTIGAVADDAGAAQGTLAGGGVTDDTTLTLTGTATAGATIAVYNGNTLVGSTTAAGGTWSLTTSALPEGPVALTARTADAAGNQAASAAFSATVDTAPDGDVAIDLTDAAVSAGGASVAFTLSGLDSGSTARVTFTGSDGGSAVRTYIGNGARTADISGLVGQVSAAVSVTDAAGNAAAGQGDTLAADPVCFMPGTLVATPCGDRAVETLRAGDLVLTADGRAAPVRWLGRQTVSTRFADPLRVLPVRIAAGALGEALPRRDLLVSADHALLVDGVLVQAGALVNGSTVRREAEVPEVFTYWHVELADHALVLAEGVPAETFIDNVARLAFDNWDEHAAAGTEAPIAEMALPRAKAHRQVPHATRRRLAERAIALSGHAAAA